MISMNATQLSLVAADVKSEISWLFEIDRTGNGTVNDYWSTKAKTFGGQSYIYKILEFSDIQLQRNRSEFGLQAPVKFNFTVNNKDTALRRSDFSGGNATVKLVVKSTLAGTPTEAVIASWAFDIVSVVEEYQVLRFECKDWVSKYLDGNYPKSQIIKTLLGWTANIDIFAPPVIFGENYVPLPPYALLISGDIYRYCKYLLGRKLLGNYYVTALYSQDIKTPGSAGTTWVLFQQSPAVGSPTSGGGVTAGSHSYRVTFFNGTTETGASGRSAVVTVIAPNQTVPLTDVPIGPAGTTQRRIYRTAAGNAGPFKLAGTISDNLTTTYNDTAADGGLGGNLSTAFDYGPSWYDQILDSITGNDGNTYQAVRALVLDSNADGDLDSSPMILSGDGLKSLFVRYKKSALDTDYTNPIDVLTYLLQEFGVPSARIDATTAASVKASLTALGLSWNFPIYQSEDKRKLISRLLIQCDTELVFRDKIYFKRHSKTSQKDIDTSLVIKGSFKAEPVQRSTSDSGYIAVKNTLYGNDLGGCFPTQHIVTASGTTTDPATADVIDCTAISLTGTPANNTMAVTAGTLAWQRKLNKVEEVSFSGKSKLLALEPDDVITILPEAYGAGIGHTYAVLIDSISITKDLLLKIRASRFSPSLSDWSDIAPATITVTNGVIQQIYSPVVSGPDKQNASGQYEGNILQGRLRIGTTGNHIVLDPVGPLISMLEGGVTRLKIGDLGIDDWGVELLDHAGASILKMDGSGNNILSGWALTATDLSKTAGGNTVRLSTGATAIEAGPTGAPTFNLTQAGVLTATGVRISGMVSGSYIYGSSLMTKGTYLAASCSAGAATLHVGDTTDFPASGSASFIDSANDRDAFTYTGKTGTTLTGCSGVLAHTVSASNHPLVVPGVKGVYISDAANEMRFFGDRGDGTIEELVNIGKRLAEADNVIGLFGSVNSTVTPIVALTKGPFAIIGYTSPTPSGSNIYAGVAGFAIPSISAPSSAILNAGQFTALRNYAPGDSATLAQIKSLIATYGHSAVGGSSPTTTLAQGIVIQPDHSVGIITTSKGLFIRSAYTGGTVTNYYAIDQEDPAAKNRFAGVIEVGDSKYIGLGAAKGRITFTDVTIDTIVFLDSNVGIGSTSPAAKLAINGGLHVGGDSDPGDNNLLVDGTFRADGAATFKANLTVDTGTAYLKMMSSDYSGLVNAVSISGNTLAATGSGINVDINLTPKGTGIVAVSGGLQTTTFKMTTGAGVSKVLTSDDSGNATWAAPAPSVGEIVQVVHYVTGALQTSTAITPYDDTIPQITEGTEFMTLAITPKSATNKLLIRARANFIMSSAAVATMALFQDSGANAIAVGKVISNTGWDDQVSIEHYMTAGTTSSTTFRIRIGVNNGQTIYFNGITGGGRGYGGICNSTITIEEIQG